MNIFKFQTALDSIDEISDKLRYETDLFWIRFGQEIVIFTGENPEKFFGERLTYIDSLSDAASLSHLYIVSQKGRLFQQNYPEIKVIHDHGRFLLVRLGQNLVGKIRPKNETCFSLIPLENGLTVFEELELATFRSSPAPFVQSLVDELNRDNLEDTIRLLTSFLARFSTSSEYFEASGRMQDSLEAMGYQTTPMPVKINSKDSQNIIADKTGSGSGAREVIIVSAHLDSIGAKRIENDPAPGADDNASGCAGLMEIARIFQNHQGNHDLRLILFGGEEQGLIGSKKYVKSLNQSERARIRAVVNMDMIGFLNSPTQNVLIEGRPFSQHIIDGLLESAAIYTSLSSIAVSLNPEDSDHVPFIRKLIPSVLTIEGVYGTNLNIHSAKDTINTINYDLALEILRMNVGYIAKTLG